jgi:hypothetical protein
MNRIATSVIAATVALGNTVPAQADVRVGVVIANDGYYYRDGYRVSVERIAFDNGYRDGIHEGEKDDRHDDRYDYRDEGRYRSGDAGYRHEYGSRYVYASAYRRGFADGYRRGYASVRHDWHDGRRYEH